MDRFGLRVVVRGLEDRRQRQEIYQRTRAYTENPHAMTAHWEEETLTAAEEIGRARELLPQVELDPITVGIGLDLVRQMDIHSHRAEFTLFEAARAHAAADGRPLANLNDLSAVAPTALRLRRSSFMKDFVEQQAKEVREIQAALQALVKQQEREANHPRPGI